MIRNIIDTAVLGLLTGASVVILTVFAVFGIAHLTDSIIYFPGIIKAWFALEEGQRVLLFEPEYIGILIVISTIAIIYFVMTWRKPRKSLSESLRFRR
ncbi:hypothetical protein KJY77_04025 [Canibacter sp. lx-72]|uniref:hypothetical protein n=1 Tax=Canibacter zhuwentaonis TaxID=2837491 RepID=UPI001BDCE2FE|nr:hypothetical protein [Canibacter zhuwentaonis]MBT1018306.1 hypothetical protein [Canibacter zhuwentaonis]